MPAVLYALGALALVAGFIGLVVPGFPGSPLLLGGVVLVAWAGHFTKIGWPTIAIEAAIAGLIFATDYVAGALGAKAFGASRWAFLGAFLGLAVGSLFGLPGMLAGPPVGAFALELIKDPDVRRAAKAGFGVLVGFAVGSVLKVALAFMLIGVLVVALLV